jgi:[acyl-carrier-protein] S-malonyltransferase
MSVAFVFPGQGSQVLGMGETFLRKVPEAAHVMDEGEKVTGIPIKKLCLEGPMEELTKTANLQPCLTAVEIICFLAALKKGIEPRAVAGHSLGEYPALFAAGVMDLRDVLKIVHIRGSLMDEAATTRPGAMAAALGVQRDDLEKMLAPLQDKGTIAIANHNSPEQIVVTGEKTLVDDFCKLARKKKVKAIPLKVSGAYHSPLMKEAQERFSSAISAISFNPPKVPIYSNVTAEPETDPERIRELLSMQICSPVRWYETVKNMQRDGISTFMELGPKNVLTNLIKKSLPAGSFEAFPAGSPEDFQANAKFF